MRRVALLACWLALPSSAGAQTAVVGVRDGAPQARLERWTERVREAVEQPVELRPEALRQAPAGTVARPRLRAISAVEALLMRARSARARLQEQDALRALASAEALVDRNLDVPGIGGWYAEVQLAIAITAAQAGQRGLSEAALLRAASVDPARVVQAAEARPEVVELARTVRRLRATAPRGRFDVRSDVEASEVSVDDARVGPLPRRVELPVGPHLIRIDAPGHVSWASIVYVREGDRPPLTVALSALPSLTSARLAQRAALDGDREGLVEALAAWSGAPGVRLVWASPTERDRALTEACDGTACGGLARLEGAGPLTFEPSGPASAARDWLREPAPGGEGRPPAWYESWEAWTLAGAALLVIGAVVLGVAIDYGSQPEQPVLTIVDEFSNR